MTSAQKHAAYQLAYYHSTAERKAKAAARMKRYREANPDVLLGVYLRRTYGITVPQYREMYKASGGECAICKRKIAEHGSGAGKAELACIDHDHATGKVRGLLCIKCNRGLGLFEDSTVSLHAAANYLENAK